MNNSFKLIIVSIYDYIILYLLSYIFIMLYIHILPICFRI